MCAPSSWRVRSPIQTMWPETSYRLPGARVDAGQRRLVVEQQRLVRGVELDGAELLRVGPAGVHEVQRVVDLAGELLVALPGRGRLHEVLVPGVHLAQVGVAAGGEGAHQVQRRGGGVVHPLQPLGVRDAGRLGEVEAVDRVARGRSAASRRRGSRCGLERGLEYWPAIRPTFTTGTDAA